MLSKFKLAFVFVLICLPASQGQAGSPYVPNPTNPTTGTGDIASMITEKVFVTDHIDVSPFLLRRLLKILDLFQMLRLIFLQRVLQLIFLLRVKITRTILRKVQWRLVGPRGVTPSIRLKKMSYRVQESSRFKSLNVKILFIDLFLIISFLNFHLKKIK
jgi:hypothetical protein